MTGIRYCSFVRDTDFFFVSEMLIDVAVSFAPLFFVENSFFGFSPGDKEIGVC